MEKNRVQLRIGAIGIIYTNSEKAAKIAEIAEKRNVTIYDAGCMYAYGVIRGIMKRSENSIGFMAALELVEDQQVSKVQKEGKRAGIFMSDLYTQWDYRCNEYADPVYDDFIDAKKAFAYADCKANLRRYFTEYKANLSSTMQGRISELATADIDKVMNERKCKKYNLINNLFKSFPHSEAVNARLLGILLKEHCT